MALPSKKEDQPSSDGTRPPSYDDFLVGNSNLVFVLENFDILVALNEIKDRGPPQELGPCDMAYLVEVPYASTNYVPNRRSAPPKNIRLSPDMAPQRQTALQRIRVALHL